LAPEPEEIDEESPGKITKPVHEKETFKTFVNIKILFRKRKFYEYLLKYLSLPQKNKAYNL
jgi:hypothetical protein